MLALGACGAVAGLIPCAAFAAGAPITAGEVIDRMQLHIGRPWFEGGVDRFIAGSPDTPVTGVACTMMATFDSLKLAVAQGLNMVITHEPTYWSHPDKIDEIRDDPLYKTKLDYIRRNNIISFHLHDHWHARQPIDGINYGMAEHLGWSGYRRVDNQRLYNLPKTTLLGLSRELQVKLNDRTMRVVGNPDLPIDLVHESWGNCSEFPGVNFLDGDADVLVIGEAQDWDLVEYAADLVASGRPKALVLLGHVQSEKWGMKFCADWLKTFVSEVPVKYVDIIEPYWNLTQPVMEINTAL